MTTLRLLLVDDHPVVRSGLRAACTDPAAVAALREDAAGAGVEDVVVVAEASDGEQALRELARHRVDVVLMDLHMPGLDGVGATRRIVAEPDAPAVLIVTTYDSDADILAAMAAGASGYVLKDAAATDILRAAWAAARGEQAYAPAVERRLAQRSDAPQLALTTREIEILAQIATGASNAQIARALFISQATVKTHLVHIFDKLGVENRTAAVAVAQERRILSHRLWPRA